MTARSPADEQLFAAMRAAGWRVPANLAPSDYERDFLRIELTGTRTREYYAQRLGMLGFSGGGRVLDAACGVGQWSVVLAENFASVLGVDVNAGRIETALAFAQANGRANCEFAVAPLERLPASEASCDAVFCYGAFMFTDMPRTLREFHRVLRPGGKVYLNANSTGWCAHLLLDRGLRAGNFDHVKSALRIAARTLLGRTSQIVVRRGWLVREVESAGFRVRAIGAEGALHLDSSVARVTPAYPARFYGMPALIELIAEA